MTTAPMTTADVDLPRTWSWVQVGELLSEPMRNGISVKGTNDPPGVPALRLNAMSDRGFDYSQVRFLPVSESLMDDLGVREGDFYVSRGNGSVDLVGRGTLAQAPAVGVLFPDTMIRLRLRVDVVRARWLAAIWGAPQVRAQIRTRLKTTAGIWKIAQPEIASIALPLPPLNEQTRIVEEASKQLSRLDAAVADLRRAQANLARYRASVLKAACEGRLSACPRMNGNAGAPARLRESQADEGNGILPADWRWVRVSEVGEVRLGRQRSPAKAAGLCPARYLRAANITWRGIDLSDVLEMDFTEAEREVYRLHDGDVLLSEASGSPGEVGKPVVWRSELEECYFQNTVLRVRPHSASSEFLRLVFEHFARSGVFARLSPGVGIHHLGAQRLSALEFPLPPLDAQRTIVEEVDAAMSEAEALSRAISRALKQAASLRQSILRAAFEGRLVPQDPADEPASALLARIRAPGAAGEPQPAGGRKPRCARAGTQGRTDRRRP